jgi:hypothetical protein
MSTELDEDYRRRVRLLRKLYSMDQKQWSEFIGIHYKKWNHYERGYPVSRESQVTLRQKLGISIDWLCFGDPSGMTLGMLAHLRHLELEECKQAAVPKKRASRAKKRSGIHADTNS